MADNRKARSVGLRFTSFGAGLLLVGCAAIGCRSIPKEKTAVSPCEQVLASNRTRMDWVSPVSVGAKTSVVIGDSYAQGMGLDRPRVESWPSEFGRDRRETVWVIAVSGSGFVAKGPCGDRPFSTAAAAALALKPNLVVVQGGINDTAESNEDVAKAASDLLEKLAVVRRVVVVGPSVVPAFPEDRVLNTDRILADVTRQAGREYLSTLSWRYPMLSDRIHPTVEGQQIYAHDVVTALERSTEPRFR